MELPSGILELAAMAISLIVGLARRPVRLPVPEEVEIDVSMFDAAAETPAADPAREFPLEPTAYAYAIGAEVERLDAASPRRPMLEPMPRERAPRSSSQAIRARTIRDVGPDTEFDDDDEVTISFARAESEPTIVDDGGSSHDAHWNEKVTWTTAKAYAQTRT